MQFTQFVTPSNEQTVKIKPEFDDFDLDFHWPSEFLQGKHVE